MRAYLHSFDNKQSGRRWSRPSTASVPHRRTLSRTPAPYARANSSFLRNRHFLATPKLKQAWLWSFGLSKTLNAACRVIAKRSPKACTAAVRYGISYLLIVVLFHYTLSKSLLPDTCHWDSVNHFRWVLFICFRVASLSGRICLPQIITALRTVLFISHPDGVINRSFLYHVNCIGTIQHSFRFHKLSQVLHEVPL